MLLCRKSIRNRWEALNEDQNEAIAESMQGIFKAMKKELKPRNQLKVEPPQTTWKGIPQK